MAVYNTLAAAVPPLLRVPLDIRHFIFDHVFPEKTVYIRISEYIYGRRPRTDGRARGILLACRQLLTEARSYIFKTTTFISILQAPMSLNLKGGHPRRLMEAGFAALSPLLASVRHLTILVALDGHIVNDASVFLMRYIRDCLNATQQPLGRLNIKFITDQQYPFGSSFTGYQWLRDSFAEVVLSARYMRADMTVDIEIPEELQEMCPQACEVLKSHYQLGSSKVETPINHFSDHQTLITCALKQFYYLTYCG